MTKLYDQLCFGRLWPESARLLGDAKICLGPLAALAF